MWIVNSHETVSEQNTRFYVTSLLYSNIVSCLLTPYYDALVKTTAINKYPHNDSLLFMNLFTTGVEIK